MGKYNLQWRNAHGEMQGVLTKPDTIQEGEEQQWLDIMEGRRHPLKHRYFVTRHPNQKELNRGITFEDARQNEMAYFATSIWRRAAPSMKSRMGTTQLTAQLSRLLTRFVLRRSVIDFLLFDQGIAYAKRFSTPTVFLSYAKKPAPHSALSTRD